MEIRARISAVMDTDLSTVFRPLIEDSKRARQAVAEQARAMGQGVATAAQQAAAREREVFKATHELQLTMIKQRMAANKDAYAQDAATKRQAMSLAQKSATDQLKIEADLYKQKEKLRAADQAAQAKFHNQAAIAAQRHQQRLAQQANAEQLRANRQAPESSTGGFSARSFASEGMRSFSSTVRAGVGVASQIARGAGVNFDLGSMIGKSVDLEKRATDLSNAGYLAGGKGAAGQRQDPGQIMADIKQAANGAAVDINLMAEGLQAFVGKTGDLELGRQIIGGMGKLARATGADINDMVNAAGDVAANLGDVENKAGAVNVIMRTIAGQGKLGAVEIKDLASQMAKLAAMAPQFSGSFEDNMANMGALVQMTRQKGGAASATQAATSLTSFVNTFSKGQRRKAFTAAGIDVEDKDGKLRSPEEIILDSLRKTKGDSVQMGKLFSDAGARRVTRGFETVYKEAGGGAAGEKAVREEFEKLAKAQMSEKEVNESFARSMQTAEAKAQLFNNNMQEVAASLAGKVLPALEQAAPKILSSFESFGSMIEKLAGMDPGTLIAGALTASIAKAALGEVLKVGVEKMMASGAGGMAGAGAIAALTITAAMVYLTAQEMKKDEERQRDAARTAEEAVANVEKDTAQYNVAMQEQAQKYDAVQAAKAEEERVLNDPNSKAADRIAATKKREAAEKELEVAQNDVEQKRTNLNMSTDVLKSWKDTADQTNDMGDTNDPMQAPGIAFRTYWNQFTGGGIANGGGPNREDLATAKAVAELGNRFSEALENAERARTGKTLRVEIANLPPGGIDPSKSTGPDGKRR